MIVENLSVLLPAALAGFAFGFLLQKGRVAKFDTIVGQLLLKNFTMAKVMFTAIVIGSIGLHALLDYGYIAPFAVRSINTARILIGGSLFGIGMAILGYCPGTSIAAWADGAKDAMFGIFGMIVGAFLFMKLHPWLTTTISFEPPQIPQTLASSFGVSPWVIIGALIAGLVIMVYADKKLKILK